MEPLSLPLTIVAILLIIFPLISSIANVVLFRALKRVRSMVLYERFIVSLVLTFAGFMAAIAAANRLFALELPSEAITIVFVVALFSLSIPNIIWLYLYVADKLTDSPIVSPTQGVQGVQGVQGIQGKQGEPGRSS